MNEEKYSISEYEEWVKKLFPVNYEWDNELLNIATERDLIHKAFDNSELSSAEIDRVKAIDLLWQDQLSKPSEPFMNLQWERSDIPRSQWWFWYDKFNDLTDEQKSTL